MVCPRCQADARCVAVRRKRIDSLLGPLPIRRHYYHCRACREGCCPRDRQLGLEAAHLTPAASEAASIAGVQTSFAQAAELTLKKLCGLRLSESTIERVTEAAGERLAKLLEEEVTFGEPKSWTWQRDAHGRRCAYVGLDAISVRQQGEQASRAEGRMAYVGMIYNPNSEHDDQKPAPHQGGYLAGFYGLDELGLQLRRQAAEVGWDEADQQIALSDGGGGLEEFFRKNFPRAECILDFWHAKEHLVKLAEAWFAGDAPAREAWLDEQCHRLKHEGGQAVLTQLEAMDLADCSAAAREAHREHAAYFRNHVHRMDYPRYLKSGWQIGSGPVESACKSVVANRLKASGMRWGEDGSDAVCHLRALFLSQPGQWEAFWKNYPN